MPVASVEYCRECDVELTHDDPRGICSVCDFKPAGDDDDEPREFDDD